MVFAVCRATNPLNSVILADGVGVPWLVVVVVAVGGFVMAVGGFVVAHFVRSRVFLAAFHQIWSISY